MRNTSGANSYVLCPLLNCNQNCTSRVGSTQERKEIIFLSLFCSVQCLCSIFFSSLEGLLGLAGLGLVNLNSWIATFLSLWKSVWYESGKVIQDWTFLSTVTCTVSKGNPATSEYIICCSIGNVSQLGMWIKKENLKSCGWDQDVKARSMQAFWYFKYEWLCHYVNLGNVSCSICYSVVQVLFRRWGCLWILFYTGFCDLKEVLEKLNNHLLSTYYSGRY